MTLDLPLVFAELMGGASETWLALGIGQLPVAFPMAHGVVLAGAVIVLPFLAGYAAFAYRVLRGRARAGLYEH